MITVRFFSGHVVVYRDADMFRIRPDGRIEIGRRRAGEDTGKYEDPNNVPMDIDAVLQPTAGALVEGGVQNIETRIIK